MSKNHCIQTLFELNKEYKNEYEGMYLLFSKEVKKLLPNYIKFFSWGLYCKKYDVVFEVDFDNIMRNVVSQNGLEAEIGMLIISMDHKIQLQKKGKLYTNYIKY